jgi:hypothetical protein
MFPMMRNGLTGWFQERLSASACALDVAEHNKIRKSVTMQ